MSRLENPRLAPTTLALLLASLAPACGGDDSRESAGTDSSAATASTTAGPTSSGSDGSESEAETDVNSGTDSDTATTTGVTDPSDATASESEATSETDPTTETETGPEPMSCEDLPPGYPGPDNPACAVEPQVGMFNPVVEWQKSTWDALPDAGRVMMAPIVLSLNDDNLDGFADDLDIPDLVYITYSGSESNEGTLRAMSGDGSKELWSVGGQGLFGTSGVAGGDIDGDGYAELLVVTQAGALKAFEHDGALKWTSDPYVADMAYGYSAPSISDMDHDGSPEIILGRVILNADGSLRGKGAYGTGSPQYGSTSFAVDINSDGVEEVVVGNALYAPDGAALWQNGHADGYPAVADFDADGTPEIVAVGVGAVWMMNSVGAILWEVPIPGGGGGPPTIADYDGDGSPEIGVAGKFVYVMIDDDGTIVWENVTEDDSSSITGSAVYDFEGDGVADVVYADEENLWVYSGVDGAVKLQWEPHNNGTVIEYPLIVDVDGDGEVEIVVTHSDYWGPAQGVSVLGDADHSWRPGRKIWNQHPYFITNVEDDGAIPVTAAQNWLDYNNFRSGDLSPNDGSAVPDLTLEGDQCEGECTDGLLWLWVHLGNVGASPLTAGAELQVFGKFMDQETLLDTYLWTEELPQGQFADAIGFSVDPAPYEFLIVRVVANEEECAIDNNELEFVAPFCGLPVPE